MKVKYGYVGDNGWHLYIADKSDIEAAVKALMKEIEHVSYEWDIFEIEGYKTVTVYYTEASGETYQTTIVENTLLEIGGELYQLSLWGFNNDKCEKI